MCLYCGSNSSSTFCRDCRKLIPLGISMKHATDENICLSIDYNRKNQQKYERTANLEKLEIDEKHGLFALRESTLSVYSILDLTDVSLYCESPKANDETVYVNVIFEFSLSFSNIHYKSEVAKHLRCPTKRTDSQHLSFDYPPVFSMFRTMFASLLEGECQQLKQYLMGTTVKDFRFEKLRAMFLLPENYSVDQLKDSYERLTESFSDDDEKLHILKSAYLNLLAELKKKGDV